MVSMTERELQKALLQELADVMPQNRPKTTIEFNLTISGWTVEQASEVAKKICAELEGKHDLHIKFSGSVLSQEYS